MKRLPTLNFPKYNFRFRKTPTGEPLIFDSIRKKWLVLTPEEWVRQNTIEFLANECGYPKALFKIEGGLKINLNQRRSDIVIYKDSKPFILVECKEARVKLNEGVLNQALNYNIQLRCSFIILTNGLEHVSFNVSSQGVNKLDGFPTFP